MGFFSSEVSRESLKPGDHIYAWRTCIADSRHGIYVGRESVIHFTNGRSSVGSSSGSSQVKSAIPCPQCLNCPKPKGVIELCLDCFLDGGDLCLFEYSVSKYYFLAKFRGGGCSLARSDPPKDTIRRASYLLKKGFGAYNASDNNGQDFAIYCKTGLVWIQTSNSWGKGEQETRIRTALHNVSFPPMSYVSVFVWTRLALDLGYRHDVMGISDVKKVDDPSVLSSLNRW